MLTCFDNTERQCINIGVAGCKFLHAQVARPHRGASRYVQSLWYLDLFGWYNQLIFRPGNHGVEREQTMADVMMNQTIMLSCNTANPVPPSTPCFTSRVNKPSPRSAALTNGFFSVNGLPVTEARRNQSRVLQGTLFFCRFLQRRSLCAKMDHAQMRCGPALSGSSAPSASTQWPQSGTTSLREPYLELNA